MKKVYLVLSQTYTNVAKTIRLFTHDKYSHASLSLTKDCREMYSFGRKYSYFPLPGVFINENINKGLFKKNNANILVYEVEVTDKQYEKIIKKINEIKKTNKGYNLIGLFCAYFRIKLHRNKYYCSEFIYEVLSSNGVNIYDSNVRFKPMELINSNFKKVFEGKASDLIC